MIPAEFVYERAGTVDEALQAIAREPDAKLISGGHSLLPLMKLRLARPGRLVDVSAIADLRQIECEADRIVIGAAVRYHEVLADGRIGALMPVLHQACAVIADPQVRHRGTVGGSAAHADPASDLAAVFLATQAVFQVRGSSGERTVPASQWYLGPLMSALTPDEILTAVEFPLPAPSRQAYVKFPHPASGYALAGAAALVDIGPDGRATQVRIAVTGAATLPFRAVTAESRLSGRVIDQTAIDEAAEQEAAHQDYPDEVMYPSAYRKNLARVMMIRALKQALND